MMVEAHYQKKKTRKRDARLCTHNSYHIQIRIYLSSYSTSTFYGSSNWEAARSPSLLAVAVLFLGTMPRLEVASLLNTQDNRRVFTAGRKRHGRFEYG